MNRCIYHSSYKKKLLYIQIKPTVKNQNVKKKKMQRSMDCGEPSPSGYVQNLWLGNITEEGGKIVRDRVQKICSKSFLEIAA